MKIVFVCTGNTCRSPMAEGYLRAFSLPGVTAVSRGLSAAGEKVSENSNAVMSEIGIDISSHISQAVSYSDTDADMFICMTKAHLEMLALADIPRDRITVLGDGIPDPFGGSIKDYRQCRDMIISAIDELVFSGKILPFAVDNADVSDARDIAELEKQTFSEPWSEQGIIDSMNASTLFFKVCKGGEFAGYAGVSIAADEGYVTNIAVKPQYRKNGAATLLIDCMICEARNKKLRFISLEVRASNESAIALYEKLGFKADGVRKNFYRSPTENAIIMTRRL